MSSRPVIRVKGAKTHNLKSVDCEIPLRMLTVVSGLSGSGKSSLAFDTLYAEGQRRYVSSLSTYARQFLERLPRPEVEFISNLPPAIAVEQRNGVSNARATVGSATELLDHLRILFSKFGKRYCCDQQVESDTVQSISDKVLSLYAGSRIYVGAPIRDVKNTESELLATGYTRIFLTDGEILEIDDLPSRGRRKILKESMSLIDRFEVTKTRSARVAEAISAGLSRGFGQVVVYPLGGERKNFYRGNICNSCGTKYPDSVPALFSWNSSLGACSTCEGFGRVPALDLEKLIPNKGRQLGDGAIAPFATPSGRRCQRDLIKACKLEGIKSSTPWSDLEPEVQKWVIEGGPNWYGVKGFFSYLEKKRYKVQNRIIIARYRRFDTCIDCRGCRLRPESLGVRVGDVHIGDVAAMTIGELSIWLAEIESEGEETSKGYNLISHLIDRVDTAKRVGLGYLELNRQLRTVSGGEAQRIQLATALGGTLTSSLYVLDEPSVGLHSSDVIKLLSVLRDIQKKGNTVVVVEHAPEIVCAADHIIELGPGAGNNGGEIIAAGTVDEIASVKGSPTGRVVRNELTWRTRSKLKSKKSLKIMGASENNLKDLNVEIPLRQLVAVSGVSGAGKSTLIRQVLVGHLLNDPERGECQEVQGASQISSVILVEPTPPGKSRRSNPATISKAFDEIRKRLAGTREAQSLGLGPGWFSFNRPGGRCEKCEGTGELVVDMQFLEDVRVPCEFCKGSRFSEKAKEIQLEGLSVVDILQFSIDEAREFFSIDPKITNRLLPFSKVGLGYLLLSQPLSSLSGGELQRLRIALALVDKKPKALYVLDEPTTGLHPVEVQQLLSCLDELLEQGASVVVIEHNLEVIHQADWVIDLGPEGGPNGGYVIAQGTPEDIQLSEISATGRALAGVLEAEKRA